MNKFYKCLLIVFICLISTSSGFSQIFEDQSTDAGVLVEHFFDNGVDPMPMGTGAAWGDYDGDGRVDLYVTQMHKVAGQTDERNYLFRNNGNGTFTDMTVSAGVSDSTGRGAAAAFADYDNDGDLDLYLGNSLKNVLYRNDGSGTFTNVTSSAFLPADMDTGRTMTVAWGDYDMDGWLDLFYTNHQTAPGNDPPDPDTDKADKLFHNNGDGTFTNVSSLLGVDAEKHYGFAASWVDVDNDCDLDLFVVTDCPFGSGGLTADERDNKLWRNDGSDGSGGWIFTEVADTYMPDVCNAAMGLATGDPNNDGYLDFAFTNIVNETNGANVYLVNSMGTSFTNDAATAGVAFETTTDNDGNNTVDVISWGTEFFDYDNDGYEDLYIMAGDLFGEVPMANGLFKNDHDGTFTDMFSAGDPTFDDGRGRTVALADYDKDGFLDMYIVSIGQEGRLLHNLGTAGARWLRVGLDGTVGNEDGIGARITVITPDGHRQIREVRSGSSYGAGTEIAAYFGLGSNAIVDTLIIKWPSGIVDTLYDQSAQTRLEVTEPGIQAVDDLDAALSGSDVSLNWSGKAGAKMYHVFRGTEAYFDTSGNFLATVNPATSYNDAGAAGDANTNYFYMLTAEGGRYETDISNRAGEFDFDLGAGFNFITLPLTTSGLGNAQELGEAIDAQVGGDGAQAVYRMVGGSWELMAFKTGGVWILTVTDALVVGDAYLVDMNVAGTWSVAGGLEPDLSNSLDVGFNSIMLPFQKTSDESIADAEDLGTSIDNAGDGDSGNAIYRMVSGSWELMAFKTGGAWIVTVADAVIAGHAYLVKMDDSVTW